MIKKAKLLLSTLLVASILSAEEVTLTDISFNMDDDGNLNPSLFIPLYYGKSQQFYSAIGFTSTNSKEITKLDDYDDSKEAIVANSKKLTLNYLSYKTSLFGADISVGAESKISFVEINDFGYIHNGFDNYTIFDNDIELDIKRHAFRADIVLPIGNYFTSRISTSIAPYTTIGVKQSTILKPNIRETGTSDSSTNQDIAYNFKYEAEFTTGSFADIGFIASYDNQPLKYNLATATPDGTAFEAETIEITETTMSYMLKILFNKELLGGLKPSIGYGMETLDSKDNSSGETTSTDKTIFSIGFERRF